jgi:putative transposase
MHQDRIDLLKNTCLEIGQRDSFQFDSIGTDGNHMHVFVGSEPKYSLSRVMQIIKSITAKQMFKAFPEIRKSLWCGEFWSDGGYIGTIDEGVTAEIIKDYVENQGSPEENEDFAQMKLTEFV